MREVEFNVDPIRQVLKGNPRLKLAEKERDALARAICRAVDNDSQGKAIARVIESPAQFERFLQVLGVEPFAKLASRGVKALEEAAQSKIKTQEDAQLTELAKGVPAEAARNIVSFLPLPMRALIDRQEREKVNLIRTGGLSTTIHPYIQTPNTRLAYGHDSACIVCRGQSPHLARIVESPRTRIIASLVVKAIEQHASTRKLYREEKNKTQRGYMLGVLEVNGTVFIAISGTFIPPDLERFVDDLGHGRFVDVAPSQTTAGGAIIDKYYRKQMTGNSPALPFYCAAPKLVEVAREQVSKGATWSMTEMWCGPDTDIRKHEVAYESCSNCVEILPMMLCMTAPLNPHEKDQDGFKTKHSKQTKNAMKAGRNSNF